ncbi:MULTISPECIES: phage baseplate assembly protein V [unclassified Lysinibacillus]|uniref:phage baseplate assembly protein V n=1 Tax=unclassified Lysinibacillus TaxID=2636778 RepID=UPI0038180125
MRVQVGEVTTIDSTNGTARVKIEEQDDKISAPLFILYRGTLKNKDYWMPKVGESVLCIFTKRSEGFILGAYYSGVTPPPCTDPEKRCIEFEDGSLIEYDSKTHLLNLNITGEINIESKGPVKINGQLISPGGTASTE